MADDTIAYQCRELDQVPSARRTFERKNERQGLERVPVMHTARKVTCGWIRIVQDYSSSDFKISNSSRSTIVCLLGCMEDLGGIGLCDFIMKIILE